MQAEIWNAAETGRVDVSGARPHGQQDGGTATLGKLTLHAFYPLTSLLASRFWEQGFWCSSWITENSQPAGRSSPWTGEGSEGQSRPPGPEASLANTLNTLLLHRRGRSRSRATLL